MSTPDQPPAAGKKPIDPARLEQMTAQLKTAVRGRRPWRLAIAAAVLLLFAVPVGLALWFFWPRGPGPDLEIVAFDDLCLTDDTPTLRVHLGVAGDQPDDSRVLGRELHVTRE